MKWVSTLGRQRCKCHARSPEAHTCVDPIRHCPAPVAFAGYVLLSSPSPCTWLSHALSTTLDKTPQAHPAGFPFHSTPPPACTLSTPTLRFPPNPVSGFPLACLNSGLPYLGASHGQERMGPPKFFDVSLPACHGLWTPADLHALTLPGVSYWL